MPFYSGKDGFYQEKQKLYVQNEVLIEKKYQNCRLTGGKDGIYQEKRKF